MKIIQLSLLLCLSFGTIFAQFEPKKYVFNKTNAPTETIWIEPQPNDLVKIYYQSSKQKARIQLISVENPHRTEKDGEFAYEVAFPNKKEVYKLKYGTAVDELICRNPDGSEQVFIWQPDYQDFTEYIAKNEQGEIETIYINYAFALGAWQLVEYKASKSAPKVRLKIIENNEACKVQFPQSDKTMSLSLKMTDNNESHFIICKKTGGKEVKFVLKTP
jgi:hypothetical protein